MQMNVYRFPLSRKCANYFTDINVLHLFYDIMKQRSLASITLNKHVPNLCNVALGASQYLYRAQITNFS